MSPKCKYFNREKGLRIRKSLLHKPANCLCFHVDTELSIQKIVNHSLI